MDKQKLLKPLIYLIIFISLVNFVATQLYWYVSIWWFDMPMHFLGGFWLGLLFFYLFSQKDVFLKTILQVLFFVFFIGIGWEIYEISINGIIAQNFFNYLDTASDLFFDLSGGLCAMLYLCRTQSR